MRRFYIGLLLIIAGCWLHLGTEVSPVNAETIYTSLPDAQDRYYQPFTATIRDFNQGLQRAAKPGDRVTALSACPQAFHTTDFAYPDIWIRDVAPVVTTRMVKFVYAPSYLKRRDSQYLNRQFNRFLKTRYHYTRSQLILDGGNVQWNGGDTIIVTRQVLRDNARWSKKDIVEELKWQLHVQHVILISPEPGDVLGHSDGMVKFIGHRTLFINDFSYEPGFRQKVEREIHAVAPDMRIIPLPSSYTDRGQYDARIASARGLYINMLETPHAIYFPQYGLKNDHRALAIVRQHTTKPVIPVQIGRLATTGGSLHCLTWDVPGHQFDR